MMFYLLSFVIVSFSAEAAETSLPSSSIEQETQSYLTAIKEKEVEQRLIESEQLGACSSKAEGQTGEERQNTIRKCIQEELDNRSNEELSKFAEDINLQAFDKDASQSPSSIREYLSERMQKAIHGNDYDSSKDFGTKNKKFVGQEKYFDFYESQLNKNILMDITRYCLENLRYNDKPIKAFCKNTSSFPYSDCLFPRQSSDPKANSEDGSEMSSKVPAPANSDGTPIRSLVTFFGQQVKEVEYNEQGNTAADIKKFSEEEFKYGAEYLGAKYQLCASGVSLMCKRYECNHTISDPNNSECKKIIGASWIPKSAPQNSSTDIALKDDSTDNEGRLACSLVTRLKEYRKTLIAGKKTREKLMEDSNSNSGYQINTAYKGVYQSGKGANEKSINEITTISSQEIVENKEIEELQDLDEKSEQLIEDCKGKSFDQLDEKCQSYLAKEESFENIEVEFEAVTALELRKIQSLKDDEEKLKKYLEAQGLTSFEDLSPEELTNLISDKYQAERLALINKMRDEFNKKTIKTEDSPGQSIDEVEQIEQQISKAADEIKDQKDRIGNLIHYNNIITSFLETKVVDSDGNVVDSESRKNSTSFLVEQEGFENFKSEEGDSSNAKAYLEDLSENVEEVEDDYQTGGGVDIIDSIISLEL